MMIPDCHKRLEASVVDLRAALVSNSLLSKLNLLVISWNGLYNTVLFQEEFKESNQQDPEIDEAQRVITEVEALFPTTAA